MGEKGAQWLVTLARLWCTSATSVPPFSHPERYLVGHFWPFWAFCDLFGHLGGGQRLQVGPDPL